MELVQPHNINGSKPKEVALESFRIKSTDAIKADVYISKIGSINKFSKGNISVWTGAAKSKKTFAISMLISSMISGKDLYNKFNSYNKNTVLWIDTEQSQYDVQKVIKRIVKMVGNESNLIMYGLRPLAPIERVQHIEQALKDHKCDVLVVDGARDLLMNINDPVESTIIVTKLMKWSYNYNIHVSIVVHQTASGLKVRGHLGSELENKAETVIKVTRNEEDINISTIEEVYGRGKGFQAFNFFIDANGLPVVGDVDLSVEVSEQNDTPF